MFIYVKEILNLFSIWNYIYNSSKAFEHSNVFNFTGCRLFDVSISSTYKLTLKVEDVAL